MSHYEGDLRAPDGARFAIIASRWNPRITDVLVAGARQSLAGNGVSDPGAEPHRRVVIRYAVSIARCRHAHPS